MREKYDHTLKEVISDLINAYRWKDDLDLVKLGNSWDKIVGKIIARHTQNLKVKNRILYINVDSSVIRNELMFARSKLIDSINKEMGRKMIDDIVLR